MIWPFIDAALVLFAGLFAARDVSLAAELAAVCLSHCNATFSGLLPAPSSAR